MFFNKGQLINLTPQRHPYHQVDASPWPIQMAMAVQGGAMTLVSFLTHMEVQLVPSLFLQAIISWLWWRDVIREAKEGYHTLKVQRGLILGFQLFLLSEIMLFASFFWAFFHSSLSPAVELGAIWPPVGITPINPWSIPLQGSSVLQVSGFIQTLGHHATIAGRRNLAQNTVLLTSILGFLFLYLQYNEYTFGEFTIADSVFGNVFYCTTGLHALHVQIGAVFLMISFIRLYLNSFTSEHHLGLEFAIYYWHLVDVVWLGVFFIYYIWGS